MPQKAISVRRAFLSSFTQRYSIMAIQFVSMVLVSRLLTPTDIGLFAEGMALPFNGSIVSFIVALDRTRAYFPVQIVIQGSKLLFGGVASLVGIEWVGFSALS